jgi:hypothetical protein
LRAHPLVTTSILPISALAGAVILLVVAERGAFCQKEGVLPGGGHWSGDPKHGPIESAILRGVIFGDASLVLRLPFLRRRRPICPPKRWTNPRPRSP